MSGSSWSLANALKATVGELCGEPKLTQYEGIGTDSRKNLASKIFIPLKGDNFDAHNFLQQAAENEAALLIVERGHKALAQLNPKLPYIMVNDTLKALQDMAHFWRLKSKAKVVAITGSNGKTSTKVFLNQLLEGDINVFASPGSFNNHWGVPLSLLDTDGSEDVIILEMGMNHQGEITELCKIAEPDIVMVTMVGRSHIGELGSIEAVAKAKEEIYLNSLRSQQIFNLDDRMIQPMLDRAQQKSASITLFSGLNLIDKSRLTNAEAKPTGSSGKPVKLDFLSLKDLIKVSFQATEVNLTGLKIEGYIDGVKGEALVPVIGAHHVTNLMAASAAALKCGLGPEKIWQKLPRCQTTWGRNQCLTLADGIQIIFDAYNANPESMTAALAQLKGFENPNKKFLVLGDMLELGSDSEAAHRELGKHVGNLEIENCWFVGDWGETFRSGVHSVAGNMKVSLSQKIEPTQAQKFKANIAKNDIVLLKASRGVALEKVLNLWGVIGF